MAGDTGDDDLDESDDEMSDMRRLAEAAAVASSRDRGKRVNFPPVLLLLALPVDVVAVVMLPLGGLLS